MFKSTFRRLIKPYLNIIKYTGFHYQLVTIKVKTPSGGSNTVATAHSYGSSIKTLTGLCEGNDGRKYIINNASYRGYIDVTYDDQAIYASTIWNRSSQVFDKDLEITLWIKA